jgi:hypothetical protein
MAGSLKILDAGQNERMSFSTGKKFDNNICQKKTLIRIGSGTFLRSGTTSGTGSSSRFIK